MGKSKLPRPIERRHLIERELSAAQSLRYAEAYLEEGRELDAVAFLAKAQASDPLAELRRRAIQAGDAFLFRSVALASKIRPTPEEWRALAEAAARAGKHRYAADAQRHVERTED